MHGVRGIEKGTLELGKLGDVVVLDRIRSACGSEIKDVLVDLTIKGGEIVFDRLQGREIPGLSGKRVGVEGSRGNRLSAAKSSQRIGSWKCE